MTVEKIYLFGKEIRDFSVADMVERGVSLIPEDRKNQGLALILSVAENVVIASLKHLFPRMYVGKKKEAKLCFEVCRQAAHCHSIRITAWPSIFRAATSRK